MVKYHFDADQFYALGLRLAHFEPNLKLKESPNRFKNKYYACPETIAGIFEAIQDETLGKKYIPRPEPADLLLGMFFLKKYGNKYDLAEFSGYTEKVAAQKAWRYVEAIQALKDRKVSFKALGRKI